MQSYHLTDEFTDIPAEQVLLVELGGSIHTVGEMVSYGPKVAKLL